MFPRLKTSYLLIGLHCVERVAAALCETEKEKKKEKKRKKRKAPPLFVKCVERASDPELRCSLSES